MTEIIEEFLKRETHIIAEEKRRTVLNAALISNRTNDEITKELLKFRTDVDAIYFLEPLLNTALRYGSSVEVVKELLSHGADVNPVYCGVSLLHASVVSEVTNDEMIQKLIRLGPDASAIYRGAPVLHAAIWHRSNAEVFKELLKHGADINVIYHGVSILYAALTSESTDDEIITELLKLGPDVNTIYYGEPVLHTALQHGRSIEVIKGLLKLGADVNATHCGQSILHSALWYNSSIEVIEELLRHGILLSRRAFYECIVLQGIFYGSETRTTTTELIIKYFLLMDFSHDYEKITMGDNIKYDKYIEDCEYEINKMKKHMVFDNMSLHDCITKIIRGYKFSYNKISVHLAENGYSENYPLYNDVIMDEIEPFFVRFNLVKKLNNVKVYAKANQDTVAHNCFLNLDCTYSIVEYLSNDDLLNFLEAFTKSSKFFCQTSIKNFRKRNYFGISESNCSKLIKLE